MTTAWNTSVPTRNLATAPAHPATAPGTTGQLAAAQGVAGAGGSLPFLEQIQTAFGTYDVTGVKAHTGSSAAEAGKALLGGQACEGKAALVLRGRGATVDGLVFADLAVDDEPAGGVGGRGFAEGHGAGGERRPATSAGRRRRSAGRLHVSRSGSVRFFSSALPRSKIMGNLLNVYFGRCCIFPKLK